MSDSGIKSAVAFEITEAEEQKDLLSTVKIFHKTLGCDGGDPLDMDKAFDCLEAPPGEISFLLKNGFSCVGGW